MDFSFDEATHSYERNGICIPSVSRVIDHAGLASYECVRQDILERKGIIGKHVHSATHYYDENDLDWNSVPDTIKKRVEAWAQFRTDTGFVPRMIEKRFIGTVNGMDYGLTADREGLLRNKPTIVDIKTAVGFEYWWGVQLAGYAMGVPDPECKIASPYALFASRNRIIVQLFENGRYKKHDFAESGDREIFCSALHVTLWKMAHNDRLRPIKD